MICVYCLFVFFCFKQKTAYELRISDWSSDVCSSDLGRLAADLAARDDLTPLFSFFGLVRDERARRLRQATARTIDARYPMFEHQSVAAAKVVVTLEHEPRRVLLHMPTGAGKTRTAMHIVRSEEHTSELQSLIRIS